MASQKIDHVIAAPIELLGGASDLQMQLAPDFAKQARVRDVLDERVMKKHLLVVFALEKPFVDEVFDGFV